MSDREDLLHRLNMNGGDPSHPLRKLIGEAYEALIADREYAVQCLEALRLWIDAEKPIGYAPRYVIARRATDAALAQENGRFNSGSLAEVPVKTGGGFESHEAARGAKGPDGTSVKASAESGVGASIPASTYAADMRALVDAAVAVLQRHAPPDGPSNRETISALWSIFDGPAYRAAVAKVPIPVDPVVIAVASPEAPGVGRDGTTEPMHKCSWCKGVHAGYSIQDCPTPFNRDASLTVARDCHGGDRCTSWDCSYPLCDYGQQGKAAGVPRTGHIPMPEKSDTDRVWRLLEALRSCHALETDRIGKCFACTVLAEHPSSSFPSKEKT